MFVPWQGLLRSGEKVTCTPSTLTEIQPLMGAEQEALGRYTEGNNARLGWLEGPEGAEEEMEEAR